MNDDKRQRGLPRAVFIAFLLLVLQPLSIRPVAWLGEHGHLNAMPPWMINTPLTGDALR